MLSSRDPPDLGIKPVSISPALAGRFFTPSATWEAPITNMVVSFLSLLPR